MCAGKEIDSKRVVTIIVKTVVRIRLMKMLCPCGSMNSFLQCCLPFINQKELPQKPEQLMRSRYTAFAKGNAQYLLQTLHPSKRENETLKKIQSTILSTQWLSLKVVATKHTKSRPSEGIVEFVAFYNNKSNNTIKTAIKQLHEKSHFIFEERWFYTEGDILPPIKLGRNDTCWCGSGKKLKACHQTLQQPHSFP